MELARAAALLDKPGDSKRLARWVAQMAGSHGYRLLSLEARALLPFSREQGLNLRVPVIGHSLQVAREGLHVDIWRVVAL